MTMYYLNQKKPGPGDYEQFSYFKQVVQPKYKDSKVFSAAFASKTGRDMLQYSDKSIPPLGVYSLDNFTIRSAMLSRCKKRGSSCTTLNGKTKQINFEVAFDTRIDYPSLERIEGKWITRLYKKGEAICDDSSKI